MAACWNLPMACWPWSYCPW